MSSEDNFTWLVLDARSLKRNLQHFLVLRILLVFLNLLRILARSTLQTIIVKTDDHLIDQVLNSFLVFNLLELLLGSILLNHKIIYSENSIIQAVHMHFVPVVFVLQVHCLLHEFEFDQRGDDLCLSIVVLCNLVRLDANVLTLAFEPRLHLKPVSLDTDELFLN